MRFKIKKQKSEWYKKLTWLPLKIDDTWVWLEFVEGKASVLSTVTDEFRLIPREPNMYDVIP